MTVYQRSSKPRLAPRVVLKNTWHEHQQQQQQDVLSQQPRETAGRTQSEALSLINAVKEEISFQVDLRVHEVSQDDIFKDEERMTEMQNLVDKLQDGCRTMSILKDLKQEGISNVFSEALRGLLSTARVDTSCEMIQQKTRSISRPCWISSPSELLHQEGPATRS